MKPIFKWDGNLLAFLQNDLLFNQNGIYLGWIENNQIFDKNGIYKGEIYNSDYGIRNNNKSYVNKIPRIHPVNIIAPIPPINRIGNINMMGYSEIEW